MATRIRLKRMGSKKRPFYRVVVADSRTPRSGRSLEELGTYDPLKQPAEVHLKEENLIKWLRQGAKPSDTVKSIIVRAGIWDKFVNGGQAGEADDERIG